VTCAEPHCLGTIRITAKLARRNRLGGIISTFRARIPAPPATAKLLSTVSPHDTDSIYLLNSRDRLVMNVFWGMRPILGTLLSSVTKQHAIRELASPGDA